MSADHEKRCGLEKIPCPNCGHVSRKSHSYCHLRKSRPSNIMYFLIFFLFADMGLFINSLTHLHSIIERQMNGTPEMNPPPPAMQDQWLTKTGSVLMTIFRPKGIKEEGDRIWAVLGNRIVWSKSWERAPYPTGGEFRMAKRPRLISDQHTNQAWWKQKRKVSHFGNIARPYIQNQGLGM